MRTIRTTTDTNDLMLDNSGNLAMLFESDAVSQETRHFAACQRGEKVFERTTGVLYWNAAFGAQTNLVQFRSSLRQSILRAPRVGEVVSLDVFRDGDVVRYNAVIRDSVTNGALTVNE